MFKTHLVSERMNGFLQMGQPRSRWGTASQKPAVMTLSFPRLSPTSAPPQCHTPCPGALSALPRLQEPTRPPSRASPGSLPRGPPKASTLSFSFLVMSLFASPVIRAETLLLPLPNFPCSERSCNPKVHIRGSGLERAAGWAGALAGETRGDRNTGTPRRTQSIHPAAS